LDPNKGQMLKTSFFQKNRIIQNLKSKSFPMYEPLQVTKCEKCGKIIAEPKELTDF